MTARSATLAHSPFLDLRPAESWARAAVRGDLFLGRFDDKALRRELVEAGLLGGLAERGYPTVSVRLSALGDEHRLRLLAPGLVAPLVDLRLAESSAFFAHPPRLRLGLEVFSLLAVRGLVLQDPRGVFQADRPRLPGQDHPGLGLLSRLLGRLHQWAEDWGKDGLVAFPPHFHVAVMASGSLRFVSPARQGRGEALRRALAAHPLGDASRAVGAERIVDQAGTAVSWEAAEMIAPLAHDLRDDVESEDYGKALVAAREGARFTLMKS
jgi:hypothetical protein